MVSVNVIKPVLALCGREKYNPRCLTSARRTGPPVRLAGGALSLTAS